MSTDAMIVPDHVTVSFALALAQTRGQILQTNGRRNCIAPRLLPGYGRIGLGRARGATIECVLQPPTPGPEAA